VDWGGGPGCGWGGGGGGDASHVTPQLQSRHLQPTELGLSLIEGFEMVDASLVTPQVRAAMEHQVSLIAQGLAEKHQVVQLNLALFLEKYLTFRGSLPLLFPLFSLPEATFPGSKVCRANLSQFQERRIALEEDLQSAVADREEKQRLRLSRAHAASHFQPQSAEHDILVSLFGGMEVATPSTVTPPAHPTRGERASMVALAAAGGEDVKQLRDLVEKGDADVLAAAWSPTPVPVSSRGGGRGGRGRGRGGGGRGGGGSRGVLTV